MTSGPVVLILDQEVLEGKYHKPWKPILNSVIGESMRTGIDVQWVKCKAIYKTEKNVHQEGESQKHGRL